MQRVPENHEVYNCFHSYLFLEVKQAHSLKKFSIFSFNTHRIGILWHSVFFTLCLWLWARRFGGYFEKIIASRPVFCNVSAHRRGLFSINVRCSFSAVKCNCSNHIKFRLKIITFSHVHRRRDLKILQNSHHHHMTRTNTKVMTKEWFVLYLLERLSHIFLAITSSTDVMFFEHRSLRVGSITILTLFYAVILCL